MSHTYFVSYSHPGGFGRLRIVTNGKIRSWKHITEIEGEIKRIIQTDHPAVSGEIVILNWIRLGRGER